MTVNVELCELAPQSNLCEPYTKANYYPFITGYYIRGYQRLPDLLSIYTEIPYPTGSQSIYM